jgi:CheY-like chemotaxis protein
MNRDMLSRRLQRRGYDVLVALDGAEGVEMAKSQKPDLILMDISLPVMDGWTATRTLKGLPAAMLGTETQTYEVPPAAHSSISCGSTVAPSEATKRRSSPDACVAV